MKGWGDGDVLLAALCVGIACSSKPGAPALPDSAALAAREARVAQALSTPDSGQAREKPIARWVIPRALNEISGLALTADGRLLVHDDEVGRVAEIDYRKGTVVKEFVLGTEPVHGDFESITVAGDLIYLLTSKGKLLEFREGKSGERVEYKVIDTRLGKECEFEGMAFEAASNSLLLACKNVWKKSLGGNLVIYRWKLGSGDGAKPIVVSIPLDKVIGSNKWKAVHPTDMTIDPGTGNYVLITQEKGIIEVTPAGEVVFSRPLPPHHPQPEGIAITKDGILLISDEGGNQAAALTLYRWH